MKILHITKYFNSHGGIEALTRSICDQLIKKYRKIDVLSFSNKLDKKIKEKNKIKIINCKTNFNFRSTPISVQMFNFLNYEIDKYDLVHITVPNPWPTILLSLLNKKPKNIIVSWGSDIIDQKFLKKIFIPFQNNLLKNAKQILCLSKNYVNHSNDLKKFKNKIVIIPPIIKSINFKKKYTKKKTKISILSVGRLVPYKGFEQLVETAMSLPDNFTFNIIGEGPLKDDLQRKITENNLSKKVKLHANVNDKRKNKFFKNADIFCFPSNTRAESFGIALLEAINYSLPVIVSNNKGSGMQDMIVDNYNGYSFKNNSVLDLKKKILKLANDKKKLKLFSVNSKKLFNNRFADKKIKNKIFKIYNKFQK